MRSLHRAVVGSGFGILAVAGVAGSVAFACTPQARLTANGGTSILTTPGSTVELRGTSFNRDEGPVTFAWNSDAGQVLGSATHVNVPALNGASGTSEAWITNVVIPADAVAGGQYFIVAFQTRPDGTERLNQSVMVSIPRAAESIAPSAEPPVSPTLAPTPAPATGSTATPTVAPVLAPAAPPVAASPVAAVVAAAQSVAVPVAKAATPVTPAVATPSTPAVSAATSVENAAELRQPIAIPAPADIWSGLDRSTSATALLDAPVSTSSENQVPVGAILLGLGTLALAGTAVVATQQRRVLAKADQK